MEKRKILKFADKVAFKGLSNLLGDKALVWYSKYDGSYITRQGMEDEKGPGFAMYRKFGITEQIQSASGKKGTSASLGFNPVERKWYGWSHRAIFGFGIGSECKKGNCGYKAVDKESFLKQCVEFWKDEDHLQISGRETEEVLYIETPEEKVKGVLVSWIYSDNVPNEKIRSTVGSSFMPYPKKWGRGEWTAKTLEDAKQMAIDFVEGVS